MEMRVIRVWLWIPNVGTMRISGTDPTPDKPLQEAVVLVYRFAAWGWSVPFQGLWEHTVQILVHTPLYKRVQGSLLGTPRIYVQEECLLLGH